jgi:hypothetical protein
MWKKIEHMPGLEASSCGRIRSFNLKIEYKSKLGKTVTIVRKPREISWNCGHTYRRIAFRGKFYYAHRLVWEAFNGKIPGALTINHKNGVRDDNRLENLELLTMSENVRHAAINLHTDREFPSGRKKPNKEDVAAIKMFAKKGHNGNIAIIAKIFNLHTDTVLNILKGRSYVHLA